MKKIKDPALFEKIRKFLTEDMPVLRKKRSEGTRLNSSHSV